MHHNCWAWGKAYYLRTIGHSPNWANAVLFRFFLSLGGVLMIAVLLMAALVGQVAHAGGEHGGHMSECAKICANCQLACDSCFKHCISLAGEGKKDHAECAQYCADCAECCKACATLCGRQSPLSPQMLDCCAKCCDACAASCEKFPDDKHMAQCAKTCRDCAKSCRDMGKMVAK